MTPTDKKQLAQKAAEFLKKAIESNSMKMPRKHLQKIIYERPITVDDWFYDYEINPILAHLAKREMEKRGYRLFLAQGFENNRWLAQYAIAPEDAHGTTEDVLKNENEYIALWSAIIEATGGEK